MEKTLQNIEHQSTHVFFFYFICFDKKKWKKITDNSLNFIKIFTCRYTLKEIRKYFSLL